MIDVNGLLLPLQRNITYIEETIISICNGIGNAKTKIANGSEFAYHETISKELNTDFYFAHPYSSWERGLNENTNGLVRQYLKKGSCFTKITDMELELIMGQLNNRPRKNLGYLTPNEVFMEAPTKANVS